MMIRLIAKDRHGPVQLLHEDQPDDLMGKGHL
jgi:hypothetical protein